MVGLSLFNGMGCFEIALIELGIECKIMYTSEVDKFALQQTRLNFPRNIELGDVRNIDVSKLERIDIIAGGSPCQSFSFAGKRKGMATKCDVEIYTLERYLELKEQGFEFEGQSYLFWEYMRILTDIRKYNPDVMFLLENVEMGAKWERVLSEAVGVFGVHINSALVSAQNRKRIYCTNIRTRQEGLFGELHADIPQPKDMGILLKDILESDVDEKYYLSEKMLNYFDKRAANFNNGKVNVRQDTEKATTITASCKSVDISDNFVFDNPHKSFCIDANYYKGASLNQYQEKHRRQLVSDTICVAMRGRNPDNPSDRTTGAHTEQRLEPNTSGKGACVPARAREDGSGQNVAMVGNRIRRLTPTECARLQTVPDWYKWSVSETQQYKMLGNGWTVEVIKHILSFLPSTCFAYHVPEMVSELV
jgi:DNA-cytosine methyltransferase